MREIPTVTKRDDRKERAMGDKGGKKDKQKSKHQHEAKQKEELKRKLEKNRPKSP